MDSLRSRIKGGMIAGLLGDIFGGFVGFVRSNCTRWAPGLRHWNGWPYAVFSAVVIHSILWATHAGAIDLPPSLLFNDNSVIAVPGQVWT